MNHDEIKLQLLPGCMGVPPKTVKGPCAAGIDIRPGSWDITIGDVLMSPVGIHVIRPLFVGKVRDEEGILFLLRQYKVRIAVADTRPETTLAQRLQKSARQHGIEVWRAEYNTAPSAIEIQANEKEGILKLDRTLTIDNVHYAFSTGFTVVLPQNYREITQGAFAKEMCAATRVPTKWMGKDCYTWEKQGDDHSLHAFNYLIVAVKQGNLIAFGGAETMGADRGIVESMKPKRKADGELDWDEQIEEGDGSIYLEA